MPSRSRNLSSVQCPTASPLCFSVVAFSYSFRHSVLYSRVCCVLVRYLGVQLREVGRAVLRREPRHGHQGAHGTVQAHQGKGQAATATRPATTHPCLFTLHKLEILYQHLTGKRQSFLTEKMASLCSINLFIFVDLEMQAEAVLCQPASAFLPVIDEVIYY